MNDNDIKNLSEIKDTNRKANKLCAYSICSVLIPLFLMLILVFIDANLFIQWNLELIFSIISPISFLIGLILMIKVRIKYPKNENGKYLMIGYILFIVFVLIFAVWWISMHNLLNYIISCCSDFE